MKTTFDKDEIVNLIQNANRIYTTVIEYQIGDARKSYFDSNSDLYDTLMENIDYIEFPEDKVSLLRNNHSYNDNSTLCEIFNVLNYEFLENVNGYDIIQQRIDEYNDSEDCTECLDDLEDMTLGEVEEKYPDFYTSVIDILDNLDEDDVNDIYSNGSTIFDCGDIYETINEETFGRLAYWTIYFSPTYDDTEVANQVGLTPFEYDGTFYLALGGCGMDLSPKLDAYVALTMNRIPKDSLFFSDSSYFKYVVGESVYNEIIRKCKLEKPEYNISFSV